MNYGELISRAAQIAWRYKFLWIFGILMALCGQGSGGGPNFQMNYRTSAPFDTETGFPEFPGYFPEPLGDTPIAVYIAGAIVVALLFGLIWVIVGAIGRSALIKAVARIEAGETVTLAESWRDGLAHAVPVGLLQAILYSPLLILMLIAAVVILTQFFPFFARMFEEMPRFEGEGPPPMMTEFFAFFPLFFGLVCGTICLAWIIQLVAGLFTIFGSRAIVLEKMGLGASFGRSWALFRQNLGPTIILAIIIFLVGFIIGIAVAIPAAAIMFPVMFSTMPDLFSETGPSVSTFILLGAVGVLVWLIAGVIGGIAQVFIEALWTLAYQQFAAKTAASQI